MGVFFVFFFSLSDRSVKKFKLIQIYKHCNSTIIVNIAIKFQKCFFAIYLFKNKILYKKFIKLKKYIHLSEFLTMLFNDLVIGMEYSYFAKKKLCRFEEKLTKQSSTK